MRKSYIMGGLTSALVLAAVEQSAAADGAEAVAAKKSIVPEKYSGKYKGAGDAVSEFINAQSSGKEGFEFTAFFALARKNGIAEDKVAHYEAQVLEEKRPGAAGRARMTLGNMIRSLARKNGKLIGLDDSEVEITGLAKPAVSGAAAKAQEDAAAATEDSSTDAPVEGTTEPEDATTE